MTESPLQEITLSEWETRRPEPGSPLEGLSLGTPAARQLADELSRCNMLEVMELRTGLMVRSFSHVGRLRLGNLQIRVVPKLNRESLLILLRYAFGFRRLRLYSDLSHHLDQFGFEDLLVAQLIVEAEELLARGLQRKYVAKEDWLSSPKGKVNLMQLARSGRQVTASLPCTHHPRLEDVLLNQVLLSGLNLASGIAGDIELRRAARRLAMRMEDKISSVRLGSAVMERACSQLNRLTVAYEPAMAIIRMLLECRGILLGDTGSGLKLPGFLFDMNRFFQELVGRFLSENLEGVSVRQEHRLQAVVQYAGGFNPQQSRPPALRPDFALVRGSQPVALLDAKYRDIWEKSLPREMLYQLAVYAASHQGRSATILYPTDDLAASEARLNIQDPVSGQRIAQVCLRPVVLDVLRNHVITNQSATAQRRRRAYAEWMALGAAPQETKTQ